jgi:hypothetical protein
MSSVPLARFNVNGGVKILSGGGLKILPEGTSEVSERRLNG